MSRLTTSTPKPQSLTELKRLKLLELKSRRQEVERRRAELARRKAAQALTFATPGDLAKAIDPTTVQTPALDVIDAALVDVEEGRCDRLIISMPPQEGKLVADSTPVPTPSGWVRHGDLRAGSLVFHPSGHAIEVIEAHPVAEATMRVHFSDHTSIVVHPAHEWTVWNGSKHRWVTIETQEMLAAGLSKEGTSGRRGHKYRFHLPERDALVCGDAELPMDPYSLGVWLGDGSASKPAVTHHPGDCYQLPYPATANCIHPTTGIITTYYGGTMRQDLVAAGVFRNKHIPDAYLRGSERQRRDLLAGLIDTDGHVANTGQISFDNANEQLVRSTAELIRTLGYRAHVHRPTPPKLSSSGVQGKLPMWRVTFTPHDQGPARLARKAAKKLGRRERIAITAITEESPEPGRCITVNSEDGLYLVGNGMLPTHNSTRVTKIGPLWALLRNPNRRIVVVSYSSDLANEFGRDIRAHIINNQGQDDTLDLGLRIAPDNGSVSSWRLDGHRGGVRSIGITGGITGRPADWLFIDDPVANRERAESEAYRRQAKGFWTSTGSTRLAPGAPTVLVLTRWHEDDLAGWLLGREDGYRWRVINIPAQADHHPERGETDPLGREPGEYMQSARVNERTGKPRSATEWEQIRIQAGSRDWNALYMGRPSPDSGNVWQRPWWRRYSTPLWSQHPDRPDAYHIAEADEIVMSWDMAFKDTKSSDFVVGQVWARRGANVYLLDQIHKRLSFTDTVTAFKAMVAKWPQATGKYVEDKANGTAIIDTLKAKIPGIVAVSPTESKYARANAVAPILEAGNVHLPAGDIAMFDPDSLIDESASFPNGAHDDQVDATSQALAVLMLDGSGAQAWIDYVRTKAAADTSDQTVVATTAPSEQSLPATQPQPDPADALRAARNAAIRQHQWG